MLRHKVRSHRELDQLIAGSHIEGTKVTVEADREIVHEKIRDLYGNTEGFENFVRADLKHALLQALGSPQDVPYAWGIFIFQPILWYSSVDSFSASPDML